MHSTPGDRRYLAKVFRESSPAREDRRQRNTSKIYTVSKPYVLRAVEASHAAFLLFADDDAVCDTMKPTSSIGGALHMAVSGEEVVSLLAAKTEVITINLLKD